MSKMTQFVSLLNERYCPTAYDFKFYYDNLNKDMHNYAQARRDYRENLKQQGIDIDKEYDLTHPKLTPPSAEE